MPDIKHFDPDAALEAAMQLFWRQGASSTGIQEVVTATGLNRSSLYSTFGGKQQLYLSALRRYAEQRADVAYRAIAEDERGLPAVEEFFEALVEVRCTGEHARWGCMITNAIAAGENGDPDVGAVLDEQYRALTDALEQALVTADRLGLLAPAPAAAPRAAAEVLVLLAYGVNLRSRAGAEPAELRRTVATALGTLRVPKRAAGDGGR
ncbi:MULTISPECIES: TetR/AcrR family transcriptional regulator [Streptomyces]|uniref:Helix-turn-helix domain-containing protein n=1 Tax=Streptomyces solicathayae TaxID=3081768 RepID=A0ABZ0LU78_9ACTN|nr:helix-turn-helix domain-containing protein [Streptomyces sp. HUAS YS2]WOX23026.1 helix-turn-helix domain-containing protein [Streptomyces sp. HUAS YS2]